jgi:hypothetical protein
MLTFYETIMEKGKKTFGFQCLYNYGPINMKAADLREDPDRDILIIGPDSKPGYHELDLCDPGRDISIIGRRFIVGITFISSGSQKYGDEDDGGSWPPESHAASRFEVPPPRRGNPQRERGVRRAPNKVIK